MVLKWHTVYCDKDGCFINGRFTEEKDFTDIEVVPERFIFPGNQSVNLKQYNGSVYKPQVLNSISLPESLHIQLPQTTDQ